MKILTNIGTRPQFVKAAVVSRAIALYNNKYPFKQIQEIIVHTGQHYDYNLSEIFFKEMAIPEPDYNLGICDCSHGTMTGRMLEKIESVIMKEKPDVVLVYGDTNSTLAGALAAAKLHVPVAHVEAGLRSFNKWMPEEINRILTDRISSILFCPTEAAVKNLTLQGVRYWNATNGSGPLVLNVGDVMYDAVLFYRKRAKPNKKTIKLINKLKSHFYLATVHRAENTDDAERLFNIIEAFKAISKTTPIVLPMHPRTQKVIADYRIGLDGLVVLDPVGYFDMLALLENCKTVFTDSGGLQKEAFFFQKPCITLRHETEWVELVENGYNVLVGANQNRIINAEINIDTMNNDYSNDLYGKGDAGERIVKSIISFMIQ